MRSIQKKKSSTECSISSAAPTTNPKPPLLLVSDPPSFIPIGPGATMHHATFHQSLVGAVQVLELTTSVCEMARQIARRNSSRACGSCIEGVLLREVFLGADGVRVLSQSSDGDLALV